MNHEEYMKIAVELAEKGMGFVNPNPMVGAVIVKDGKIIGRGYHRKYGELHAERNAFADCTEDCSGADMYVTLEPCCHHGKTPPCTDIIIEKNIRRVFIGSSDPNPKVAGKGVQILREHGIEVTEGVLKEECDRINEIFFHYITTGKPFVTMKYAMTMDGKIACRTGLSKWITAEPARQYVQHERMRHSAIMVGVGTVIADNPMLNCRLENSRNPVRIVCDTNLRTPIDCNIVKTAKEIPTVIATCSDNTEKITQYEKFGCRVMRAGESENHIDLKNLMDKIGAEKIDSILLEGGSELNYSALKAGIVNKIQAYVAPKIFGGQDAKTAVSGFGVDCPDSAYHIVRTAVKRIGDDFLIEGWVK
ncbi:MAG: bifunctional diaminohydroxyphosphoribosylaminopyrimidine deaminase/5-amino-6-(5-phosphoribosylamino)uracil reductase RibD [Ruminococcus flavefaciens]|nr:bifunctional diaminohydroxyphosphoribosylaminopyrimidine deaminase/5-amino-6-(5-phosphoribosylamino)uracil reductase RibD [Ruminococcus flavefaciens]